MFVLSKWLSGLIVGYFIVKSLLNGIYGRILRSCLRRMRSGRREVGRLLQLSRVSVSPDESCPLETGWEAQPRGQHGEAAGATQSRSTAPRVLAGMGVGVPCLQVPAGLLSHSIPGGPAERPPELKQLVTMASDLRLAFRWAGEAV